MRSGRVPGAWTTGAGSGPGKGRDLTPMALASCVGLCTLPVVFLLVTPWFGFRAALGTALAVLAGITVACWALCASGRAHDMPAGFRRWGKHQ